MGQFEIRSFLPLHPLEFRVLLMLSKRAILAQSLLVQRLERRRGDRRVPYPVTLFRYLRALLDKGLIEEAEAPVEDEKGHTYLRISVLGEKVIHAEAHRLERMVVEARQAGVLESG